MRVWVAIVGLALASGSAGAQRPGLDPSQQPPLQQQWQQQGIPPSWQSAPRYGPQGLQPPGQQTQGQQTQGQQTQGQQTQGQQTQGQQTQDPPFQGSPSSTQGQSLQGQPPQLQPSPQSAPPSVAGAPSNAAVRADRSGLWLPVGTVKLQALDKVNAQSAALTLKVGGSASFGSLTIVAKACVIRPADQPADAAAYLDVTDSHPDAPAFDGWMLQNEPSASMLQHPIYDLRVTGCA
jgi:hypothetical protein